MIRRPPRSTLSSSSAASDVYKRQVFGFESDHNDVVRAEGVTTSEYISKPCGTEGTVQRWEKPSANRAEPLQNQCRTQSYNTDRHSKCPISRPCLPRTSARPNRTTPIGLSSRSVRRRPSR